MAKGAIVPMAPAMEMESAEIDDPTDNPQFGVVPMCCVCPHCKKRAVTVVTSERSPLGQAVAFLVICYFGIAGFVFFPLLAPILNDVIHTCPRCYNVIVRRNACSCPGRGVMHSCKVGKFACVFKQAYIYIVLFVVGLMGASYMVFQRDSFGVFTMQLESVPLGSFSALSWQEYHDLCGTRAAMRDTSKAVRNYELKFHRRHFIWNGRVRQISLVANPWVQDLSRIVLDMQPADQYSSVVLFFGGQSGLAEKVADVLPGDWLQFNATMVEWGRRGLPTSMILRSFSQVDLDTAADHTNATQRLHAFAESLAQLETAGGSPEQRREQLRAKLSELAALADQFPEELVELRRPEVLAARFPGLALEVQDHEILVPRTDALKASEA